ncbi:hypothetical protein BDV3_006823 [Batrachochytrium dendrobatidis]
MSAHVPESGTVQMNQNNIPSVMPVLLNASTVESPGVQEQPVFNNDAVNVQVESDIVDSMVSADTSRVLLIYTGGTIGMQNSHPHGYRPVKGYLTQTLANMLRFHTQTAEGWAHPHNYGHGASTPVHSVPRFTNLVNVILEDSNVGMSTANSSTTSNPSNTRVVNGTPVKQIQLPALISPPSLYGKRINYSILEYEPLLDSSNMTMTDWVKIATNIEVNYRLFDAFIILHGTDTMAYTASALSFMLEDLGKTVIVTGSQVPLAEVRNDAVDNLLGALTIAGHFVIPEVGLFFDNKLFRGNRSSKVNAVDFNAFDSPNLRPLVNVGINIDVSWVDIWRPKRIAEFRTFKAMNPSVATLRLFPGITEATVRAFLSPPIAGVVLETYGSGNAPSNRHELLKAFKEACDRGVVIVNCTQCKRGLVTDIYETGKALTAIGIVPGADMTPECALTKLSYLLAKYSDVHILRRLMRKSLRGELTIPVRRQRFTYFMRPSGSTAISSHGNSISSLLAMLGVHRPIHSTSRRPSELLEQDSYSSSLGQQFGESGAETDDPEAYSSNLENVLVPLLLCQAVRAVDLSGLTTVLNEYEHMVNVQDYDGRGPLHVAASDGQRDCVELLLRHGANVHLRDNFGHSALFDCVSGGHVEVASLLRKAGSHFSLEEESDVTWLLCKSVVNGDVSRVRMLMECGADMNKPVQDGRTALHLAVSHNHIALLQLIIHAAREIQLSQHLASCTVQSPISPDVPPLSMHSNLSLSNLMDMSRGLSSSALPHTTGVNLEPVDGWGNTPLDDAVRLGRDEAAAILRDALILSKTDE